MYQGPKRLIRDMRGRVKRMKRDHGLGISICAGCRSIPRNRALVKVLNDHFPGWRELQIHESLPGGPSSDKIKRECKHYVPSQFFPEVSRGCKMGSGAKIWRLSYSRMNRSTLSSHRMRLNMSCDQRKAFAEIARTLKPGTANVYTVPYYRGKKQSYEQYLMETRVSRI
jgi:hypothetical protein